MATFAQLVRLDGAAVEVNIESNFTLEPVPASLLPVGVAAGTFVTYADDGTRLAVQGTVAQTSAALAGGVATGLPFGVQCSGLGTIFANTGLVLSVNQNGVGEYQVLLGGAGAQSTLGPLVVTDLGLTGSNSTAQWTGIPGQILVQTFDAAGMPADLPFSLIGYAF